MEQLWIEDQGFLGNKQMRITRQQLRRLIAEAMEFSHDQIVQYLTDNATSYHNDPALDPGSIEELLLDDFMDNIGAQVDIRRYKGLSKSLSQSSPKTSAGDPDTDEDDVAELRDIIRDMT